MTSYSNGGYIPPSAPMYARVYDHGDHKSMTPTHRDEWGYIYCDRIFTKEEVSIFGPQDLRLLGEYLNG